MTDLDDVDALLELRAMYQRCEAADRGLEQLEAARITVSQDVLDNIAYEQAILAIEDSTNEGRARMARVGSAMPPAYGVDDHVLLVVTRGRGDNATTWTATTTLTSHQVSQSLDDWGVAMDGDAREHLRWMLRYTGEVWTRYDTHLMPHEDRMRTTLSHRAIDELIDADLHVTVLGRRYPKDTE